MILRNFAFNVEEICQNFLPKASLEFITSSIILFCRQNIQNPILLAQKITQVITILGMAFFVRIP